jgi:hypothetical protein
MLRTSIILMLFVTLGNKLAAQSWHIGADIGRAYFKYQYKDYGQGYSNEPQANYGLTAQFSAQKTLSNGKFFETGLRFVLYEQYYSTRLYDGTWEQNNPVVFIPALLGYILSQKKIFVSIKGGILLGIMPDQYEADYFAFFHPDPFTTDSITRGTMKRNFTPLFPLVTFDFGVAYRFSPKWKAELRVNGAKGFIKITEFDIYYNDGTGRNDQRAKQWGKGDYASITLGFKYSLRDKKKKG